jgi:RNA polymerase sigma factor (sigma-70 family)
VSRVVLVLDDVEVVVRLLLVVVGGRLVDVELVVVVAGRLVEVLAGSEDEVLEEVVLVEELLDEVVLVDVVLLVVEVELLVVLVLAGGRVVLVVGRGRCRGTGTGGVTAGTPTTLTGQPRARALATPVPVSARPAPGAASRATASRATRTRQPAQRFMASPARRRRRRAGAESSTAALPPASTPQRQKMPSEDGIRHGCEASRRAALTRLRPGGILRGAVLTGPPEAILAILRTARSPTPDPRLSEVLEAFRRRWLTIARVRYPGLGDDAEDAVQAALLKLVSGERLDGLKDPSRLEAWARSLFVHTVLDVVREGGRHHRRRAYLGEGEEDPEALLRERVPSDRPNPEEMTAYRERLAIVTRCVERLEVGRLRFLADLPEKEIAERRQLSRDAVAGQLKRLRQGLRRALGDDTSSGLAPSPRKRP